MTTFRVWAPLAESAQLRIEATAELIPMELDPKGWFVVDVPDAKAGVQYRYVLDNSEPMPDPRSAYQPSGVHGPSEVVDHSTFPWTDNSWKGLPLQSSIIYELHIGTFTEHGTFDAAIDRLDHLVELGVSLVELLPVAEFAGGHGWGYDGVDLYAPHHAYGGPDGMKRFVDACHTRGLGVIVDVVYNHLGPDGNYLSAFGPYFTDKYGTPWGQTMNFDGPYSDEVRQFVIDNALMWLRDYHADGLRLDAVHTIFDFSALHILEAIDIEIDRLTALLGRNLFVVAESDDNNPRLVSRRQAGGYGIDAQWSDDFHHALHAVLTGESSGYYGDYGGLEPVAKALRDRFVYTGQYQSSRNRKHGRAPLDIPAWQFIGYMQNHDQIGNRARGERSSALMNVKRLKIAAALVLTAPFIPMLFQGEEWAASTPFMYFTDHEPELGKLVSAGRKREFASFGWNESDVPDPQALPTFLGSKLKWDELNDSRNDEMLAWHKALIRLRRSEASLNDGGAELEARVEGDVLWVSRGGIVTVINLGTQPFATALGSEVLLSSGMSAAVGDDGSQSETLLLEPDGVAIFRKG